MVPNKVLSDPVHCLADDAVISIPTTEQVKKRGPGEMNVCVPEKKNNIH